MKGIFLEVPTCLLESRRRTGADKLDEMWDGVLHMVPPPGSNHQTIAVELLLALGPLAKKRGLRPFGDSTGTFRPGVDNDWRIPDNTYARPEQVSDRGVEGGAPFIVEIRSPHDETDEKLPFYGEVGVGELLVVDPPTRRIELYRNAGGRMEKADGPVVVEALGVACETVEGPKLRLTWAGGSADI